MKNDFKHHINYTFEEVITILSNCKTSDDLFEISFYIDTYKKKYPIQHLRVIENFLKLKYLKLA